MLICQTKVFLSLKISIFNAINVKSNFILPNCCKLDLWFAILSLSLKGNVPKVLDYRIFCSKTVYVGRPACF